MISTGFKVSKRGISTIVGTMFFLVLAFAVFGAMLTAFQFQSSLVTSQRDAYETDLSRAKERFSITPSGTSTLKLEVKNQGSVPIEVVDVWLIEKLPPYTATQNSVLSADSFVPPGATIDVLKGQSVPVGGGSYYVKAVTALGTVATSDLTAGTSGELDENSLVDKLVAKPSVYASFPNPLSAGKTGYFALTIANPTPYDMWINRTSIQLITPTNPGYFSNDGDLSDNGFGLTPTKLWSTVSDGLLLWKQNPNSIKITKYNATEFKVNVTASSSISAVQINTINTNTFSTFGQFGSTKIDTLSTESMDCPVPNVFQSTTSTSKDAKYFIKGVQTDEVRNYHVTISNTVDASDNDQSVIAAGSNVIINIPKQFTITDVPLTNPDFQVIKEDGTAASSPYYLTMQDKSFQIRLKLLNNIEENSAKTYTFTTKAPSVSTTKLYLFYIYAIGTITENSNAPYNGDCLNKIMGPVAETIVQVCNGPLCT